MSALPQVTQAAGSAPLNQYNIGDSIGVGEAANNTIGAEIRGSVWSTGFDGSDVVESLNERFEQTCPADYVENNSTRESIYNQALSGADMDDFVTQAGSVIAAAGATPEGEAGMVSVLLGANDVCAATMEDMTSPVLFESRFRAGLDVLAASAATQNAGVHVSSIPAIYWLWNAKRGEGLCPFVWQFVPCENLLSGSNDCESEASILDPDTIYAGDGDNCRRRKKFHEEIRDTYNPILRDVLQEYVDNSLLPNAYYLDIFDIQFSSVHINNGDCFHPSREGHALLAEAQWSRSPWPISVGEMIVPVLVPFLLD